MSINKKTLTTLLSTSLGIVFIFFLWWIIALSVNSSLFPDPNQTFTRLFILLGDSYTWISVLYTLLRLIISFVIVVLISTILGIIAGRFEYFAKFLNPIVITLRTLPTAALIFILIVLTKPLFSLQIILFLMMFPIVYQAVVNGYRGIDVSIIRAIRLEMNVMSMKSIFKVIIPYSWQSIILGCVQALGLGMKAGIMAEVLLGNSTVLGIGRILKYGYDNYEMDVVFAISIVAIVLIGAIDILLNILKKKYNSVRN